MKPEAEPNFNEQDVIAQLEKPPTITQAHHDSDSDTVASNSPSASIEHLPQQPKKLSNARENAILLLLTISQLVQILPLGIGINAGLEIGRRLGASSIQSTWVVASYPLTQGSFVLIGGRLGTIYGHKNVLVGGALWWTLWCALIGYADNLVAVSFLRGLCGIGGGLMIPNIIALIGINFPPGRKRNLGFALFGAMAPIGAAGGSLVGAVIIQLSAWKWAFFLVALLGAIVFGATAIAVLNDEPLDPNGSVDIVGSYLGVGGLVLFNFVWNQAPIVGWDNPYEIALLVVSVLHIAVFAYWESKVAKDPILPFNIWGVPSFGRLIICVALSFMSLGIFYWYMIVFMQTLRHDTLIQVAVQFLPLTIVGTTTPFLAAWMVPRLPAQVIIGIGCWAMCFPALFVSAFTIDLITTSAQIVISSTVPLKHQGVAGSLVGTLLGYGMSTGLGFAGTVEVHTFDNGRNLLRGYHSAAYLAVGMSAAALIISLLIRILHCIRFRGLR